MSKPKTPLPWSQGRTLSTPNTRRWSDTQWNANEAIERRHLFSSFLESDAGRSRVKVAEFRDERDAQFVVELIALCREAGEALRHWELSDPSRFEYEKLLAKLRATGLMDKD